MASHHVITKDYPENLSGGIMVCGINFGYSAEEEALDAQGKTKAPEPLSFFLMKRSITPAFALVY